MPSGILDHVTIGHLAIDTIIIDSNETQGAVEIKTRPGGAVTFASIAAKAIDPLRAVGFAGKAGGDIDPSSLEMLETMGIDTRRMMVDDLALTTAFELHYQGEKRTLRCPARCSPIDVDQIDPALLASHRVHLGPLCGELDEKFIRDLGGVIGPECLVGMDLQGFIRDVRPDGSIGVVPEKKARSILSTCHETFGPRLFLKSDDIEAASVTGSTSAMDSMEMLVDEFPGTTFMITSGRHGSLLGRRGDSREITPIPAFIASMIVDETGAGDTFLAAFLSNLNGKRVPARSRLEEAALFASATSSFLVEQQGITGIPSRDAILKRILDGERHSEAWW